MPGSRRHSRKTGFCLVLACATLLCGCLHSTYLEDPQVTAYRQAVFDAETAEENEIFPGLSPVTASNPDLVWDGSPGESNVLVVTWTSWSGYASYQGQTMKLSRDVWVTVVPDVKVFYQENAAFIVNLPLRLEQLHGVPPYSGKEWFVELWADPDDLFRPAPDPEITDTTAGLEFPADTSQDHIDWIEALQNASYGPGGYPWTRLGYTYDWNNQSGDIGISEYVVRTGSDVVVHAVTSNEQYFE